MRYLVDYFKKLRRFIGRKVYVLLCLMAVIGFIEVVSMALLQPIIQSGFGDDKLSRVLKFVFGIFGAGFSFKLFLFIVAIFFVVRAVSLLSYTYYSEKIMTNLVVVLRRKVFEKVFSADYLYILKKEAGYINNLIVREIPRMADAFDTFAKVMEFTILALVYIALAFVVNFKISLILAAFCPPVIFFMMRLNTLINQTSIDYSNGYGRFQSLLIQSFGKFKYLKATFSNRKISVIVDKENKNLGNIAFRLIFLQSLSKELLEPMVILFVVGLLFYHAVIVGRPISEIIFLVILLLQAARQFLTMQSSYRKFLASRGSIETFSRFEDELDANKEDLNLKGPEPYFDGDITFKDVKLVFPNGKTGLDGINVTIRPKSVVAFVGHSGSGKSTIANMLTGILKPTSGRISMGNESYAEINIKALREKIGYVTQEDIIFNASVEDNISLWSEKIDEESLEKVIEMAHITRFVNELPHKEKAMLGDNGLDISGGQRQRITIARELYKKAKLLILDEATSSLDSKSEKQIYENLKEFKGKKTMVVIAHRLSTIKNADYIYVMDEGKIVEGGTFEELHADKGTKFYDICQLQKM